MKLGIERDFGKLISAIHRKAHQIINLKLRDYDIDVGQIFLLRFIHSHDGISQEQVAQNLYLDKTTVSKNVKRLMRNGYLRRIVNQKDQREYKLSTTKKAETLLPKIDAILKDINKLMILNVSKGEQHQLELILEKMLKNFK